MVCRAPSIFSAHAIALFSSPNDGEKRVCAAAVQLLMHRRFRFRKIHHRQELREKLRAEMPPRVPGKIFRRRRETRDRSPF